MLKILKDCRLCGVSVHAGEMFPICDFDEADIQIVIGAGFAERCTPPAKKAETVSAARETSASVDGAECSGDKDSSSSSESERTATVQVRDLPPARRKREKKAKK